MYLHRAGSKEIHGKNKRSANRPNRLVRAYESGYIFSIGKEEQPEDSLTIKERVNRAVQIQRERYANEKFKFNSQLSGET